MRANSERAEHECGGRSPVIAGVALDRAPSGNGHRTPATVALATLADRTTDSEQYGAAAPDARSQVWALVAANAQEARP